MVRLVFTFLIVLVFTELGWGANLLPVGTTVIPADTLGSELITAAADRDFSSDTGFWQKGAGWTISGGVATQDGTGAYDVLASTGLSLVPGKFYTITYTVTAISGGTCKSIIGSAAGPNRDTTGTYTETYQGSGTQLLFNNNGAGSFSVDNVSIRESQYTIGTKAFYSGGWIQNLPGVISGDVAGIWSVVSGPDANGKAYQVANTGSTDVVVTLTPTKALTVGRHYHPIVIAKRTVGSGTATYKLTGGTAVNITSATFVPLAAPAVATNTTDKPTFTVPAGTTIQFYQPKLLDNADGVGFNFGNFDFRY